MLPQALAADIRLGHGFTEAHPRGQAMARFAAEVDKATHGQIKVKVFANSSLGSEEKMLQAVQGGVQEFYMGSLVPFSVRKKELQIFDFPFLFSDAREVAMVLDGPINGDWFEAYVTQVLIPELRPGDGHRVFGELRRAQAMAERAERLAQRGVHRLQALCAIGKRPIHPPLPRRPRNMTGAGKI